MCTLMCRFNLHCAYITNTKDVLTTGSQTIIQWTYVTEKLEGGFPFVCLSFIFRLQFLFPSVVVRLHPCRYGSDWRRVFLPRMAPRVLFLLTVATPSGDKTRTPTGVAWRTCVFRPELYRQLVLRGQQQGEVSDVRSGG